MKITMIETRRGSEDGHTIRQYELGETYDVAYTMGCSFINNGWATRMPKILTERQVMGEVFDHIFKAFEPKLTKDIL